MPFLSFDVGSIEMPRVRAPAWIVAKLPVRPTKSESMPLSHLPSAEGVSRFGSVVTNTTRSLSCWALGSCFLATARLFIVSGQTSGQWV